MAVQVLSFVRHLFQTTRAHLSVTTFPQLLTASALLLTVGLFTIMQSVVAGSGLASAGKTPDIFQSYAEIMPGRPSTRLVHFQCSLANVAPMTLELTYDCQRERSRQQPLRLRGVGVSNGEILYLTFEIDRLRLGDLVRRWGQPDSLIKNGRFCMASWRSGKYAALSACSPSLFLTQVNRVIISRR